MEERVQRVIMPMLSGAGCSPGLGPEICWASQVTMHMQEPAAVRPFEAVSTPHPAVFGANAEWCLEAAPGYLSGGRQTLISQAA